MSGPAASPSSSSATGTAVIAERLRNGTVLGVDYVGICCGAGPHHVRAMAEALGREVPAGKYSPALELHPMYRDAVTARDAELRGLLERLTAFLKHRSRARRKPVEKHWCLVYQTGAA